MCALVYFTLPCTHTQHKSRLCTHTYAPARARARALSLSLSHTGVRGVIGGKDGNGHRGPNAHGPLAHRFFCCGFVSPFVSYSDVYIYTHKRARAHTHTHTQERRRVWCASIDRTCLACVSLLPTKLPDRCISRVCLCVCIYILNCIQSMRACRACVLSMLGVELTQLFYRKEKKNTLNHKMKIILFLRSPTTRIR